MRRGLILCWLVVTAACGLLSPDEVRVLGIIEPPSGIEFIEVSDTVSVSTPFTVPVVTFGDGCYRGGDTTVEMDGNTVMISPYDWSSASVDGGSGEVCTSILREFEHSATVEFGTVGAGTIILRGRDWSLAPVELQFPIWVE